MASHIRMRDNNTSPHPVETPATPLVDTEDPAWPSPPPSTRNSLYADKPRLSRFKLPQSKPLFRGFESPSLSRIAILTVLCLLIYPAFYALTLVAKDKSLFVVRSIVAVWCWGIGFALGCILLKIGAQHLEAATWATVMHKSYEGGDGMKLRDLARSSGDPKSFMPAFHLLRSRFGSRRTSRGSRKSYDKRPWSLFLGFFVVLAILAPTLNFLFGRIIVIDAFVSNQRKTYREVLIAGDLSQEDISQATIQLVEFENFTQTWSLLPYGRSASDTAEFVYGSDTVYFAQPSLSQFVPGGSGAGTFDQSEVTGPKDTPNNTLPLTGRNAPKSNTGVVLRHPQWGIRIHCEKLPNPKVNLVPFSNRRGYTHVYIPKDFLRGLFGRFGMDLPTQFTGPVTDPIPTGDTPTNIDLSTMAHIAKTAGEGPGVVFNSVDVDPVDDQGWMTVETVLLRLQTDYTPSGSFPVSLNRTVRTSGLLQRKVGFDAAVCVQKYEPWIVETYNTSIVSPSTLQIVKKGNDSNSSSPSGNIRGPPIANAGYLNATGKEPVFTVAHGNSINQMVKDSSGDIFYAPSLTAVSFTNGTGLRGYTELSPDRLAIALGRVGAANALPYFAGSRAVVAKSYEDETLAFTTFNQWQLIALTILIWTLGVIGELFVPTLPLNIPRRGFGVYSWLALFQSQELEFEAADDLEKLMPLDEFEDTFSDKRVRFVVEKGEV